MKDLSRVCGDTKSGATRSSCHSIFEEELKPWMIRFSRTSTESNKVELDVGHHQTLREKGNHIQEKGIAQYQKDGV